jgi:hypothetical protein
MMPDPEFTVTLRAAPGDTPGIVRLRQFLKHAWRAWRLRCVALKAGDGPPKVSSSPDAAERQCGVPARGPPDTPVSET